ncbi:MAG: DUF4199 family protein [Alphaproteobacteria bacterium]|nr:DUF4199 family protein [Alphaproteobacteria bacterium]
MLRIALAYGSIAGAIVISVIVGGIAANDGHGGGGSQLFGYLVMLVALSLIFVGVRQYRDKERGGVVSFRDALACGLAIAGVAGVIYVAVWELYLAATDYAFMADYAAGVIEAKRDGGATDDEIASLTASMADMEKNYANPLFRLPMTFLEIFPVGVVVSLIAAALFRNRNFLPAKA